MMKLTRHIRALTRLGRWLGPWADAAKRPKVGTVNLECVGPRSRMRMRIYRAPGTAKGALFLIPGLHFAGADDPRMDRFAAILAHAGYEVCTPFLPAFLELTLAPTLLEDAETCLRAYLSHETRPPGQIGVLSISFGSIVAFHLACHPDYQKSIGRVFTFGGYCDLADAMRFCLTGAQGRPHDPLNRPVVYLNMLAQFSEVEDPEAVATAWRGYVHESWGDPANKAPARWRPMAERWSKQVSDADRALFLYGCGTDLDPDSQIETAIAESTGLDWLDPKPILSKLTQPLYVVHGADDDVIPVEHAQMLADSVSDPRKATQLVTGLYTHAESAEKKGPNPITETWTMVRILNALAGLSANQSPSARGRPGSTN